MIYTVNKYRYDDYIGRRYKIKTSAACVNLISPHDKGDIIKIEDVFGKGTQTQQIVQYNYKDDIGFTNIRVLEFLIENKHLVEK